MITTGAPCAAAVTADELEAAASWISPEIRALTEMTPEAILISLASSPCRSNRRISLAIQGGAILPVTEG
jgi:hypothetical protein